MEGKLILKSVPVPNDRAVEVCRLAQTERMTVIAGSAVGVSLTVSGGIAEVVGIVLLALLVALLLRGAVDS